MSTKKTVSIDPEFIPGAMAAIEDAADVEVVASNSVFTHYFSRPYTYEGVTYTELSFDFNNLTGKDSLEIENELQALGRPATMPEFSAEFLIRMSARACTQKVGCDVIANAPLRDFNQIRSRARRFLLGLGL